MARKGRKGSGKLKSRAEKTEARGQRVGPQHHNANLFCSRSSFSDSWKLLAMLPLLAAVIV
jgi:hypothetical protein